LSATTPRLAPSTTGRNRCPSSPTERLAERRYRAVVADFEVPGDLGFNRGLMARGIERLSAKG
jgi:hypothetical protein